MKIPDDLSEGNENQPSHPDFWKLADIVLQMESEGKEIEDVGDLIRKEVDEESLMHMAIQRAIRCALTMARERMEGGESRETVISTGMVMMYVEGFVVGKKFAERGGKS